MIICKAHGAHVMTLFQTAIPGAGSASLTWQADQAVRTSSGVHMAMPRL